MIREPFAAGDSLIHRVDPRLRVLAATSMTAIVTVGTDLTSLAAALSMSLAVALMARLPARDVLARLRGPALFLVLLWCLLPWSLEGPALSVIGPVTLSGPGVALCALISLKTFSLLLVFMALVATMTIDTLGNSLSRLGLPDKMVHLLLLTYRYLFVLEQEYQRLRRAITIRNFHPGTNLHSYRTYAYLVGMIFVRASERARRVHCAMLCRGFCGRFVSLRQYPPTRLNHGFVLCTGIAMALLAALSSMN